MTSSFRRGKRDAIREHAKKQRREERHVIDKKLRLTKGRNGSALMNAKQRRAVIDRTLAPSAEDLDRVAEEQQQRAATAGTEGGAA